MQLKVYIISLPRASRPRVAQDVTCRQLVLAQTRSHDMQARSPSTHHLSSPSLYNSEVIIISKICLCKTLFGVLSRQNLRQLRMSNSSSQEVSVGEIKISAYALWVEKSFNWNISLRFFGSGHSNRSCKQTGATACHR
jgi:hypothetical protein